MIINGAVIDFDFGCHIGFFIVEVHVGYMRVFQVTYTIHMLSYDDNLIDE